MSNAAHIQHAQDLSFTPPRRQRADPHIVTSLSGNGTAAMGVPSKLTDAELKSNAFRVAQGIEDMQKERDANRAEISDLKAQLVQHVSRITSLESEKNTLTLERDAERSERIRLASGAEQLAHLLNKLVTQPNPPAEDDDP